MDHCVPTAGKTLVKYLVTVNDNTCSSYMIYTTVLVVIYLKNAIRRRSMSGKGT